VAYLYPIIGIVACWIGLESFGPPQVQGTWQPVSILLWLGMAGFSLRFIAALVDFDFGPDGQDDGR
jgi:hypothetical protein